MSAAQARPFGELLKHYRLLAGLSQEDLAARAGLSPRGISDLERGARRAPRPSTLTLLADALGLAGAQRAALFVAVTRYHTASPALVPEPGDSAPSHQAEISKTTASPVHIFLIANVRGYTRYTQEHGDEAGVALATKFAALVREVVAGREGQLLELRDDTALVVFTSAPQALRVAVEAQMRFARETASDPALPVRVGIGLDAGEAVPLPGDYPSGALNMAAQLCSLAGPGEVLASDVVVQLAHERVSVAYAERDYVQITDLAVPRRVFQVLEEQTMGAVLVAAGDGSRAAPVERQLPLGAFLGALPEGPIVAREAEVARITAAVDVVVSGMGRLLLLTGEPGVGKTRLAQEASLAARDRGLLVVTGRCYEPQQAVAYFPFLEALTKAYIAAPAAIRQELARRWPQVLRLLPDQNVGVELPVNSRGGLDEQRWLFWQVTDFLQALAAERPLALLIDDLHWADGASLALLQHLARHTREHGVLLLTTCREEEIKRQPALKVALRELEHERLVDRVAIRRLPGSGTAAQIAAIIGAEDVPAGFAALLHARTGGNPFFTQEVLRALVSRGDLYRENSLWRWREIAEIAEIVVPDSVRSVLDQRVAHLSPATLEILQEASVLGQTFAFDDLRRMGQHVEADVEAALGEEEMVGLVRELDGDTFGFSHVLIQQALYSELPMRKRRRLHRAAAEAIEQSSERGRARRTAELAQHYLKADEGQRALPYTLLAGDQARATFAHGEAQRHYRKALELAGTLGDRPREAEALEKLAKELGADTRSSEVLELSERAVIVYRAVGDVEGEGRAVGLLCEQNLWLGQLGWVIAHLESRLEELRAQGLSKAGQARLCAALARALMWPGHWGYVSQPRDAVLADLPRAVAVAEQAVDLARAAMDDETLAQALWARASTRLSVGLLEAGLRDFEAVAASAEAAGNLDLVVRALNNAQYQYQCRGEFGASRRCIERSVALAERTGSPQTIASVVLNRGDLAYCGGNWDQARADFERAMAILHAVDVETRVTYDDPPLYLGLLCLAQGQMEAAAAYLAEPLALAERANALQALRISHAMLAECDLLEGRPEAARARLEPLLERPGFRPEVPEYQVQYLLPPLAWAYLELGNEHEAAALAGESGARTRADHQHLFLVEALRVQALIATRQGRWHKAQEALEESIALCRAMPYPYAEAKAHYVYGQLHAAEGELERAREAYQAALDLCACLGEGLYRPHIERARTLVTAALSS